MFYEVTELHRRLTLVLSCAMSFQLYPHDTQECTMKIESREYSNKYGNNSQFFVIYTRWLNRKIILIQ